MSLIGDLILPGASHVASSSNYIIIIIVIIISSSSIGCCRQERTCCSYMHQAGLESHVLNYSVSPLLLVFRILCLCLSETTQNRGLKCRSNHYKLIIVIIFTRSRTNYQQYYQIHSRSTNLETICSLKPGIICKFG